MEQEAGRKRSKMGWLVFVWLSPVPNHCSVPLSYIFISLKHNYFSMYMHSLSHVSTSCKD